MRTCAIPTNLNISSSSSESYQSVYYTKPGVLIRDLEHLSRKVFVRWSESALIDLHDLLGKSGPTFSLKVFPRNFDPLTKQLESLRAILFVGMVESFRYNVRSLSRYMQLANMTGLWMAQVCVSRFA